jgi:surface-adhesin protein E
MRFVLPPQRRAARKRHSALGRSLNLPIAYCWTCLSVIPLLMSCVGLSYAGWVPIYVKGEEGRTEYTVYVEQDSLHYNGDVVTFWVLMDFTTVQTVPRPSYLSVKSRREIDCTEEQIRLLAVTAFSGNMGNGDVRYTYSDAAKDRGISIEPGSVAQKLWQFVCEHTK